MGAWGHGLLQNDCVQDALVGIINGVQSDVLSLAPRRAAGDVAGRAGAGIGLLLQLSATYWFSDENPNRIPLLDVLRRQEPAFDALPRAAARLLQAILEGRGPELVHREGRLPKRLQDAFLGDRKDGFPMERMFGKREPYLFQHRMAVAYVRQVSARLVKQADQGFRGEEVLTDLCRTRQGGGAVAALVVLLLLEPRSAGVRKFQSWRDRWLAAQDGFEADPSETDFYAAYNRCLALAFAVALRRFRRN
jgi:hypothetical protein